MPHHLKYKQHGDVHVIVPKKQSVPAQLIKLAEYGCNFKISQPDILKHIDKLSEFENNIIQSHRKKEFCTLANSINICNIMKLSKKGRPYKKFPKLMETHKTLFKTIPNNLHNSLIDIYVCFRCFHMLEYGFDILEKNKEFKKEFNRLCGL